MCPQPMSLHRDQNLPIISKFALLHKKFTIMMAATAMSPPTFDDHASLSASLEDFEHDEQRSPLFGLPSQHSGFKSSEESEPEAEEARSEEPWSPPAWRSNNAAGGWYRHQPYSADNKKGVTSSISASRSKETSPQYESAAEEGDITMPANIPLPRGSISPIKEHSPNPLPMPDGDRRCAPNYEEDVTMIPVNNDNCLPYF